MSDIMGKIGELLSDEESIKQLSELAQMLMTDTASGQESDDSEAGVNGNEDSAENIESDKSGGLFSSGFDLGALMKLQGLMGAMTQKDKNSELLLALKPHLREEKQEKVDKAIKLLKLLAVWNIIKESGMLKDLL